MTRLQPGVAGLSFLSPTWSLGNSLVVLQGQLWMRSWSSCRNRAAGHPDGPLMGIQAGLPQGLSTGQLGLTLGDWPSGSQSLEGKDEAGLLGLECSLAWGKSRPWRGEMYQKN